MLDRHQVRPLNAPRLIVVKATSRGCLRAQVRNGSRQRVVAIDDLAAHALVYLDSLSADGIESV